MYSSEVVPTGRGFATSYGYLGGQEDHLTHSSGTAPGASVNFVDLYSDAGNGTGKADMSQNGIYSTPLFTAKAISVAAATHAATSAGAATAAA